VSTTHNARERLLDAARDVFARFGAAGATTRRIAEVAGVNEVTVFRLFGSKESLLDEAARAHVTGEHAIPLPDAPKDPQRELAAWCAREMDRLRGSRAFILQCLSEESAHPELGEFGAMSMTTAADELRRYVDRMAEQGRMKHPGDREAALTMLLGAMYTDSFGRPTLAGAVNVPVEHAPGEYVRLFLRALGVK
jgi:AcrR family transcriptional regulator